MYCVAWYSKVFSIDIAGSKRNNYRSKLPHFELNAMDFNEGNFTLMMKDVFSVPWTSSYGYQRRFQLADLPNVRM